MPTPRPQPQARYRMRLLDWTGQSVADFTDLDIRSLEVTNQLNDFAYHTLSIAGDDARRAAFKLDYILEVWRRVQRTGAEWYLEYAGLHRTPQDQLTTANHDIFTTYGRGYIDLLRRREILYAAGTAFSGKTGPGETVMKAYVEQNIGASSSSGSRKRSGIPAGGAMLVEADQGRGVVWQGKREWSNLLDTLQDIAKISGVDFQVVRLAPAVQYQFRTLIGADRSANVIFGVDYGNMENPLYVKSRTEEATVAVALGQGQGAARATQTVLAAAMLDSPWNDVEITTEGRTNTTAAELTTAASEALLEKQAQSSFTFDVLQTSQLQYGADYFVGDTVRAIYKDVDVTLKIIGCVITLNEGREVVRPVFSEMQEGLSVTDQPLGRSDGLVTVEMLAQVIRNINKTVSKTKAVEIL